MTVERTISVADANELLQSMIGEYTWFVRCAEDGILRMEIGCPHLSVQEPMEYSQPTSDVVTRLLGRRMVNPTGHWSLFVEDGLWDVEAGDLTCSRFDTDRFNASLCLSNLSGQKVKSAIVPVDGCNLIVTFDLGAVMKIRKNVDYESNSQWILFFEDGKNLSFGSQNEIIIES